MRKTNFPTAMTYAQMEHALYMRKRERQADKLVMVLTRKEADDETR